MAIELPEPGVLMAKYRLESQAVTVIEPHESKQDHNVMVGYQAFSINKLLSSWFGDSWKTPGTEIVFLAQDGYKNVVKSEKFDKYHAFLAFGRTDGSPFRIDNIDQNQHKVPLGPYYLIWENIGNQELLSQGAYGWPYQVKAIALLGASENQPLQPKKLTPTLEQGLSDAKTYCLTCHHINGVGGTKYPRDLLQAACQWENQDLKALIETPSRFLPNPAMPSLGRMLPVKERRTIIDRVVSYLTVMQSDQGLSCIEKGIVKNSANTNSKGWGNMGIDNTSHGNIPDLP